MFDMMVVASIAAIDLHAFQETEFVLPLSAICLLCNTPFAFGFGLAAFIIGLKKKHPATWIIGLVAAVLAILSFFVGIIALIGSIVYAAI